MLRISWLAWSIEHRTWSKIIFTNKLQNNLQALCSMLFYNNLEFIPDIN